MASGTGEIGLFPLGIVLLPGERVPLHIFEQRYRDLIGECLETGGELGLVLSDESGLREIGCRAAVTEVLRRFSDGRLNIMVEGRERFRVLRLTSGRTFLTAQVEPVADQEDEAGPPTGADVEGVLRAYRDVAEAAGADAQPLDPSQGPLAYRVAGAVDLDAEVKQSLLEALSERERLVRLTEALDRTAQLLRLRRIAAERARRNGHVIDPS